MGTEGGADWLSVSAALAAVMRSVPTLDAGERPLLEALGSVLAEDVVSDVDLPPWDNSAMDGFAVHAADVAGAAAARPVSLRVVDDIPAGGFPGVPVGGGEAARIMTGAPVPAGCDSVIRVEHTDGGALLGSSSSTVTVLSDADAGRNIRPAGDDVRRGDAPLRAGQVVTPARIAVAASLGRARLRVVRRPLVAVLTSGDELVTVEEFDQVRAGRRIVSSNGYALAAQLAEIGCEVRMLGIARDTPASVREHVERARGCDALVTSAGVSVGEHDHVRGVLADFGTEVAFWRMRARPGSALAFGRVGALGGIPWFGLPGNPVSTMVCFELFARPALLAMAGHRAVFAPTLEVRLGEPYPATGESTHFARARLTRDESGVIARLTRSQSSGVATALADADGLVVIPPGPAREPGTVLRAIPAGAAPPTEEPPF